MDDPVNILQISDCHLSRDPVALFRGMNPDAALESMLPGMAAWKPELVLATGDLSEDGSAASYRRLARHLQCLSAPVYALPGNHDDSELMHRFFHAGPWREPGLLELQHWRLVLLDSAVRGRIDGAIDHSDIRYLHELIRREPEVELVIALHHQPVPLGSPWIDRYMLQAPEPLLELVANYSQVRAVVWGHVHQSFEARLGNARMLACPSTAANSLPGTSRFVPDPTGPACRWLQLHADGRVETGLLHAG